MTQTDQTRDPAADAARFPAITLADEGEWARLDLGGAGEGPATPPEAPLDMPAQDFRGRPPRGPDARWPSLRTILARRTALIIAHRLTTVEIADRVLVVEHGQVVEDGSPRELIGSGGRYAGLHQAWTDSLV